MKKNEWMNGLALALAMQMAAAGVLWAQDGLADDPMRDDLRRAATLKPHPRQVAWQELEFIAFIHFGVNTFTDREWGTGKEEPAIFNPFQLDACQWVAVCKDAGMKQIILTAKHHDGFCLWPSRYTPHSVKNSPWKNGRGDVVRELAEACREAGLKLGIYLSPADLNAIERGVYGSKNPPQKRVIPTPVPGREPSSPERFEGTWDEYNTYFMNQLFELLTEYGEVSEVWFDGANPKPGTGQTYAYQDWYHLIRKLQPQAVIFGKGPDVRWVGNESGGSRKEEWSVLPIPMPPERFTWPDMTGGDLGSRAKIKGAAHLVWYPAETDVSIRPGWFYHERQDNQVKSLEHILDMYYRSVGGNSVFLLNLPPDRRGLIHENDARRMREVGQVLRATFSQNLATGARATASAVRGNNPGFSAAKTVDEAEGTYWTTDDWTTTAEIAYDLPRSQRFDLAMIQEQISEGQRIEACAVDAWIGEEWRELASATTVGYKRLLRFDEVETAKVRLRVTRSRLCPTVSNFGLFRSPEILAPPRIRRDRQGRVSIEAPAGVKIRYTLDGSKPTSAALRYEGPIAFARGGVVRAVALAGPGTLDFGRNAEAQHGFGLAKTDWRLVSVDSEEKSARNDAVLAFDDDPDTFWHTQWTGKSPNFPHEIVIDLGRAQGIAGFGYLPRQDGKDGGLVSRYEFYVSPDGKNWGPPAARGEFGNILNNPIQQSVNLDKPAQGRFIRFRALASPNGKPWAGAAELDVYAAD